MAKPVPRVNLLLPLLSLGLALKLIAGSKAVGDPPVLLEHPIGRTASEGGHVTLSVMVQSSIPVSLQWWKGAQPLTNDSRITGATSPVLNLSPVQTNDSAGYYLTATSSGGAVTSRTATVTVSPPGLQLTVIPGQGLLLRTHGPVGEVYRMESANNVTGPWMTNGYATNYAGYGETFLRFAGLGNFLRPRFDHMLPVLYPSNAPTGGLRAYGKLNQVWRFQATTNFLHWEDLGTLTNTSGWVKLADPLLPRPARRFYRLTPP